MSRSSQKVNALNPFGPPSPDLNGASAIAQGTDLVPLPIIKTIPSSTNGAILTNPFDALDVQKDEEAHDVPLTPGRNRDVIQTNDNDEPYRYNENHSRGAIFLNDYDFARASGVLDYKYKKVDAELPRHILLFRKALYVAQMMLLGGSIIIAGGAYVAENNGWKFSPNGLIFGHMEQELVYTPYACGIMSLITALFGFIGAKTREKCGRAMLIAYVVMVIITLILASASTAQAFADRGNVFHYAERQWNKLTVVEERIFEWENFCCNFNSLEPCCRFGYGVTDCVNEWMCFERVEGHLKHNFNIIAITACLQTINTLAVTLAAIVLLGYIQWRQNKQMKKKMKQGQKAAVPQHEEQ